MMGWLASSIPSEWKRICTKRLVPWVLLELGTKTPWNAPCSGAHLDRNKPWAGVPSEFHVAEEKPCRSCKQAPSGKHGGAEGARWERPGVWIKRAQDELCWSPLLEAGWARDCRYTLVTSTESGQPHKTKGCDIPRKPMSSWRAEPGSGPLPILWWSIIFPEGRRGKESSTALRGSLRWIKFD